VNILWNQIAEAYAAELVTTCDDLHFGVGIAGNRVLSIVEPSSGGIAIELGCGSGENLVALHRLGYQPIGVDSSDSQLELARELLKSYSIADRLILGDACTGAEPSMEPGDLVLSVGVGHFCPSLREFIGRCLSHLKPGGQLVLSLPHPVDMITQMEERGDQRAIILESYYPIGGRITNAHYWRRFAGHVPLADGLTEFICRPGDLVNTLLDAGFEIRGLWEPEYSGDLDAPCVFKRPDSWFAQYFYPRVPQYLIVKAFRRR
jgi:SAM-dependent methyltransferase